MQDIIRELATQNMLEYTSVPFWSWNNQLDDDELIAQIRAMKDAGIQGFTMHARTGLKEEYLSERWFHFIEVCLDEAKRLGMRALVYDENGWPSGFVGGALLKDPANLAQYLQYAVMDHYDEQAFAVYALNEGAATWLHGPVEGLAQYHCVYLKSSPANTDILNPDVVTQFIDATYEEYYRRFGERFGHELMGFFTDEPQYYRYETPYTRVAAPIWRERYGGDIREGLVYLFILSEAGYVYRTRYYTLLNELYTTNYYKRLYDWCVAHHCEFTGHSIEESNLQMQMWGGAGVTPSYEYETIPGIDHLGRAPAAQLSAKQVGSAAAQLGKKHVLTEIFGCSGWDATPRELRLIGDAQYVRGVNMMCQHLSSYSLKGQGKVDHPPCFSRHMTWWKEYRTFNNYFDRLGYLIANGRDIVNAVVINPMASVYLDYIRLDEAHVRRLDEQFAQLYGQLTQHCISYHLADERILARHGRVENGRFVVGQCSYNSVILPACRSLSVSTKALLQQYVAAGGHVYLFDGVPAYTEGAPDDYGFLSEALADHYADLAAAEALPLKVSAGQVQFCYREGANYKLVFVVNEGSEEAVFTLPKGRFAQLDLQRLRVQRAPETCTLAAGCSVLFLRDYAADAPKHPCTGEEQDLTDSLVCEGGDDNCLILDTVSISTDGEHFDEPHYVYEVFERLVKADYQGDVWVRYGFEVQDVPERLRLLAECNDQQDYCLNGQPLQLEKSDFDIFYQQADLSGLVQPGHNVLQYRVHWWQAPGVRYALFDPEATESLRNCLAYDTEIEPVFLQGTFKVTAQRSLAADDGQADPGAVQASGYPHFCGRMTFAAAVQAKKAHARLELEGRYMVCGVKVNGVPAGECVLEDAVEVELVPGEENIIELELASSLRNMFGPHHMGLEPGGVNPTCFTMRGTWEDGHSPLFHADYNVVPFGLTGVRLRYEA